MHASLAHWMEHVVPQIYLAAAACSRAMKSGITNITIWSDSKALLMSLTAAVSLTLPGSPAHAIPGFSRQTGMRCAVCHTVFPELNAFGRQFKLRGYTLSGQLDEKMFPVNLPLSASLIGSYTDVRDTQASDPAEDFTRTDKLILQTAAVYYAGRIIGKSGAFAQYNYDGIERAWAVEMVDARYADSTMVKDKELLYGLTLNNGPSTQDVWNSAPMWSFPHLPDAGVMPAVGPLIDMRLAQQAGGLGGYGFWNNALYAELSFYRTTERGALRILGAGTHTETVIDGYAPYWHVMLTREMGVHNLAAGIHGLTADILLDADDADSPTDRYRDLSLDAQYQYLGETHIFTTDATWIREKRIWNASFPSGMADNPSDLLHTFKINAHYWNLQRMGGGIGYFSTTGDSDMMKYCMRDESSAMGNATGIPDSRGWTAEVNYLPLKDQSLKIGLRRTEYSRFNGARSNYNGFGRDAADNNATFLYIWILL